MLAQSAHFKDILVIPYQHVQIRDINEGISQRRVMGLISLKPPDYHDIINIFLLNAKLYPYLNRPHVLVVLSRSP